MTWGSWGTWGEYWVLFCVGLTIAASKAGDLAGWWIFLVLAYVGGYVGLNVLQKRIEPVAEPEPEEEGWRAACPYCDGAIVDKTIERGFGDPDDPETSLATAVTKRITLHCEFDHEFDVEQTQQRQDRGFRVEWKGRRA